MRKITLSEYNAIPEDYRGIWTVERWDLPDWADLREKQPATVKLKGIDGGPHKQWSMWFNSTQRWPHKV